MANGMKPMKGMSKMPTMPAFGGKGAGAAGKAKAVTVPKPGVNPFAVKTPKANPRGIGAPMQPAARMPKTASTTGRASALVKRLSGKLV